MAKMANGSNGCGSGCCCGIQPNKSRTRIGMRMTDVMRPRNARGAKGIPLGAKIQVW